MPHSFTSMIMLAAALILAGLGYNSDSQAADTSDNADAVSLGDYYEARLSYEVDFYTYICRCQYDNAEILPGGGYESEQECLESQIGDPDEIDEIASCAQDISDQAENPPAWVEDVVACRTDNHQSARHCLGDLDLEGECSESILQQVGMCHQTSFGENQREECDSHFEETGDQDGWLALADSDVARQCIER